MVAADCYQMFGTAVGLEALFYGGTLRRWLRMAREQRAAQWAKGRRALELAAAAEAAATARAAVDAVMVPRPPGPSLLGARPREEAAAGSTAAGKRRARPTGKEAALTAARGPAFGGMRRYMSDEEWAAAKEQLEASISDDDEYLRETLSLLDTTPSPEGRAEFLRMVLSEAAEGGGGGGGAGPSGGA